MDRGGLFTSEEAHHLEDSEEVDGEDDQVEQNVKLGAEFDVLAGEHGGKMQAGRSMVKEIERTRFPQVVDERNSSVEGCESGGNV